MALFLFTKAILAGEPIRVFNQGNHTRDFTYVDDIVEGVIRASDQIATPDQNWTSAAPDSATSNAPYRIFNIGNSAPV
jgi:UDP-glucuronate 4-epimerase